MLNGQWVLFCSTRKHLANQALYSACKDKPLNNFKSSWIMNKLIIKVRYEKLHKHPKSEVECHMSFIKKPLNILSLPVLSWTACQ